MPAGKLAAQAGHAYTDSLMDCMERRHDLFHRYRNGENAGSKGCLKAKNETALRRLADECAAAGIPHAIVIDSNHILPPHFDGSPIMTAVGVGPISWSDARAFVKRFSCV